MFEDGDLHATKNLQQPSSLNTDDVHHLNGDNQLTHEHEQLYYNKYSHMFRTLVDNTKYLVERPGSAAFEAIQIC